MGDGGAKRAAKNAAQQAERTSKLMADQVMEQKAKAAKDAERAQRLMMRSFRGAGGGFFMKGQNNPVLGDSSGVLG